MSGLSKQASKKVKHMHTHDQCIPASVGMSQSKQIPPSLLLINVLCISYLAFMSAEAPASEEKG